MGTIQILSAVHFVFSAFEGLEMSESVHSTILFLSRMGYLELWVGSVLM